MYRLLQITSHQVCTLIVDMSLRLYYNESTCNTAARLNAFKAPLHPKIDNVTD